MPAQIAWKALSAVGAACLALTASPALAEINVSVARITEGYLWVIGQADEPNAPIALDDTLEQTTDSRGRFEFRVVYHPATCIVTLRTASQSRQAVVSGCGQAGPKGDPGVAGPPGPPGPAGPPGAASLRGSSNGADAAEPQGSARAPAPPPQRPQEPPAQAGPAPGAEPPKPPATETARLPAPKPERPPAPPPAPVPAAPPAAGEWLVEDGAARINIQPCGGDLCGAVSWSKEGGGVGTQILRNMKPAGPNRWEGTILDPTSGKVYQSSITLQNPNTLRVQGCVLGILCGGQTWTRAR